MRDVPASEAPGIVVFPILPPPGLLLQQPASDQTGSLSFMSYETSGDGIERAKLLIGKGLDGALAYTTVKLNPFLRLLTKIARGYHVSEVGFSAASLHLNPFTLGKDKKLFHIVGGTVGGPLPLVVPEPDATSPLHQIWPLSFSIEGIGYIAVQIRLFAQLRPLTPIYTVVMGERQIPEGEFHNIVP